MEKETRDWHKEFIEYMEFIVNHKNYKGLYYKRKKDGSIQWVVTGKSEDGQKRKKWWDEKCNEFNINIEAGCYAKISNIMHPTKIHICQICGKSLSIRYVYPNKTLLKLISKTYNKIYDPYDKDIFFIINEVVNNNEDLCKFLKILKIKNNIKNKKELLEYVDKNFVETSSKGFLSPGVMSNCPDRFDGFHSDGNCCRSKSDKGRHKENLSRYSQDRRVYENWTDGNWKMADRLMSLFGKYNLSADHIGPISLGFCHRPKFQPMTVSENATKNNRMSFKDVKTLIQDEENGEQVVSWHSKYIWDLLKNKVKNDSDAKKLSNIMRLNLHHILIIFSIIYQNGYEDYLKKFLHPEYSFYDYKFKNFNPKDGTYEEFEEIKKEGQNQKNNVNRYYRISMETLKEYVDKENRKNKIWKNKSIDEKVNKIINLLNNKKEKEATNELKETFNLLAINASNSW